jgi:hypothetical protein
MLTNRNKEEMGEDHPNPYVDVMQNRCHKKNLEEEHYEN